MAAAPSREPSTMLVPQDTRPASNAILTTFGTPSIFPATASGYCTAAYNGKVEDIANAPNDELYKSGFVYVEGDKKNPAGLFHVKTGKRDAEALDEKPFTLISLSALADSSESTILQYALPPLYYARAAGKRDAVLALHKHACDEQPNVKTNQIWTVTLDMKLKKWVVDGSAPLRRSAFEVAVENGFEKSESGNEGCRACEAGTCTIM